MLTGTQISRQAYDLANRIKTLTNANSEVTTWSYDDAGRLTRQDMANLSKATYSYDNADRLTGLTNSKSDDTVISSFAYTYYDAGGKKTATESGGAITTYTYDEADRLTREQRTVANAYDYQYTYDYVGNRLTMVEGGTSTTTYTYDVANQLTVKAASDLSRTTYSYDNNGNLTQADASGSITSYTWDYENHMLTDTLPSSAITTFTYDGDGLRRQSQTATTTTKFILDGQDVLLETDNGGTTQVVYTQTPDMYGNTISQRRGTTSAFYHYDALGSTSELTDASQNVTDTNRYYAFGGTLASSGSTTNAYGYVGKQGYYSEPALGLQYLRARWYDPSLGRFVSEDPLGIGGGDVDLYAYVRDNPANATDPSGLYVGDDIRYLVKKIRYAADKTPSSKARMNDIRDLFLEFRTLALVFPLTHRFMSHFLDGNGKSIDDVENAFYGFSTEEPVPTIVKRMKSVWYDRIGCRIGKGKLSDQTSDQMKDAYFPGGPWYALNARDKKFAVGKFRLKCGGSYEVYQHWARGLVRVMDVQCELSDTYDWARAAPLSFPPPLDDITFTQSWFDDMTKTKPPMASNFSWKSKWDDWTSLPCSSPKVAECPFGYHHPTCFSVSSGNSMCDPFSCVPDDPKPTDGCYIGPNPLPHRGGPDIVYICQSDKQPWCSCVRLSAYFPAADKRTWICPEDQSKCGQLVVTSQPETSVVQPEEPPLPVVQPPTIVPPEVAPVVQPPPSKKQQEPRDIVQPPKPEVRKPAPPRIIRPVTPKPVPRKPIVPRAPIVGQIYSGRFYGGWRMMMGGLIRWEGDGPTMGIGGGYGPVLAGSWGRTRVIGPAPY